MPETNVDKLIGLWVYWAESGVVTKIKILRKNFTIKRKEKCTFFKIQYAFVGKMVVKVAYLGYLQ